ncbi:signal recognition particle protein [Algihabitans albus]|uniref:signal recognition particle protein n=1 Tax=Algihabitans albus TaxID=2164067 RepID=UPI000E5C90EF|nr:signal recognition particle protein [Algihabitans albus]
MFDGLQSRLGDVFDKLRRRASLSEDDVNAALREVRVALLEADVALPVVKDFIEGVRPKAVGQEVLRSVTPGQQVVKIVHDHLVEMLGGTPGAEEQAAREGRYPGSGGIDIDLNAPAPVPILMVGLQGSGKTTTTGKIAKRLSEKQRKKVLMASLDTRRPAAQQQLKVLGEQVGVATLPIVPGEPPVAIAKRALSTGKLEGYDVVLLDTAGRLAIDEELMAEVVAVRDASQPHETLLVADAMTGQDAVNVAATFNERVGLTGIALTRVDGDARGGAALSMKAVTGKPIKLLGTGEKLDALESFHPERVAGRILGMGDIVSLVEKAAETLEQEDAEAMAKRLAKGRFDLNDMHKQLQQLTKMGGLKSMMQLLPGVPKIQDQLKKANVDDKVVKRQMAIISSMTKAERTRPELIKASRRQRIAKGSGTSVPDVNKLLKQFAETQRMVKKVKKMGGMESLMGGGGMEGLMPGGGAGASGLPGGMPPGFGGGRATRRLGRRK